MELVVLGCSGSYGSSTRGACSGYLVRAGRERIWVDCGNGTFANLQEHVHPSELSAVIVTHAHPDHSVDLYGLHVLYRYGLELTGLPVFAPEGVEQTLRTFVAGDFGATFDWRLVADGDKAEVGDVVVEFSRTDHPPPTMAVQLTHDARRLVYTSDTGPAWSPDAFGAGADLVLSEATYPHDDIKAPIHLSARQAGELARAARARRLVLTHFWPTIDVDAAAAEGAEAFGDSIEVAEVHRCFEV
ncbi:MAG TPA: MBL fold metallo-hydrolase [Acidimicrobiia bacterium]|nr:MBL fold metallo-hydrolase [Acidimicrobiia bacterium]